MWRLGDNQVCCTCVIGRLVLKKQFYMLFLCPCPLFCIYLNFSQPASTLRLPTPVGATLPLLPSQPPLLSSPSLIKTNFYFFQALIGDQCKPDKLIQADANYSLMLPFPDTFISSKGKTRTFFSIPPRSDMVRSSNTTWAKRYLCQIFL